MSKKKEQMPIAEPPEFVLVVDSEVLEDFRGLDDSSITTLRGDLDQIAKSLRGAFFMSRNEAEEMPMYKQIIPYLIISSGDSFLAYRRAGAEKRLTDLISIGIGGHINPVDSDERKMGIIKNNVRREVEEELRLDGVENLWDEFPDSFTVVAVLYDDSNDVGKVHLGVVLRCDVPQEVALKIRLAEENKDLVWKTLKELEKDYDKLEGWSKVCVGAIPDFFEVKAPSK